MSHPGRHEWKPRHARASGRSPSGPVADGARVFHEKGCEFCHTVAGNGGIRGPDLTYAGDPLTPAQMTTRIFSGATNMPSYKGNLTPEQLSSLLAFLDSRHRQPPKPTALPMKSVDNNQQPLH